MKAIRSKVSLFFLAATLAACLPVTLSGGQAIDGSGTLTEETRPVSGVTAIQLSMPGTLHIEIGSSESLRITAEDNLLAYIQTESRAGELDIRTESNVSLRPSQPIDYYLTVQSLDTIHVTSSGDVEAPALTATHFDVGISSSGSITIEALVAETLRVDISSSGSLAILGGAVERQEISISSSGAYAAKDLESQQASIRLSSSGSATVRAVESLQAELSSSGNVYYLGAPQLRVDTSSSGKAVPISD
jgi:hypothetical protein